MSSCFKCGKTLPAPQTECEYGCGQASTDAAQNWLREQMRNRLMIDWTKVKTAEDVIIIFSVLFAEVSLASGSREAQFLARYLKPPGGSQPGGSPSGAEPTKPS